MSFLTSHYLTGSIDPEEHTPEFAERYLRALGARVEAKSPSLLRSELDRDQLCELENRPKGTWYTANNLPDISTLYLWTDPHAAPEDERAEMLTPGSWRLELIRQSVQRIGAVTRLRVVPKGEGRMYVPFLIFGFEVARRCLDMSCRLLPVGVNLVTGASGHELATRLFLREVDEAYVPRSQVHPRELRYKHAFEVACEWVKEFMSQDPQTWEWYYRASYRLSTELEQVEAFFEQRRRDGETDLDSEEQQAIEEVRRRFQPRIEARPALAALVLCPEGELP